MRSFLGGPILAVCCLGLGANARADYVFLKDGFALRGKVKRESVTLVDPAERVPVNIPQGFFLVDDFARRIYFSPAQVEEVREAPHDLADGLVQSAKAKKGLIRVPITQPMPPILEPEEQRPFDDNWDREYYYSSPKGRVGVNQHLSALSPFFAQVSATKKYPWSSYYLTNELGPEVVRSLLSVHPEFVEKDGMKEEERAERRFRYFNFCVLADWLDLAADELARVERDLPGQKEKTARARENLNKLLALRQLDRIKVAQAAGRHRAARQMLDEYPEKHADEKWLAEVRDFKAKHKDAAAALDDARRFLAALPKTVSAAARRKLFEGAAADVLAELTDDHFLKLKDDAPPARLEAFVTMARQAEKQKDAKKPEHDPEKLMALAVSGWVLGPGAAGDDADAAERLWQARQFALAYLRSDNPGRRGQSLADYQKQGSDVVGLDELAQLLPLLPPVEPEEKITLEEVQATARSGRRETTYHYRLPPEYHHGRPCPVLIVLHHSGEAARDHLRRWSELAAQHGYILAAPEWGRGPQAVYGFSAEDHGAVLDVLRDLRRRFQVDSDRVFLAGYGQGGSMAFDVGLSHPDLFAGVTAMASGPQLFSDRYWRNAQYLPFYVVNGDYAGDSNRAVREQFQKWVPRNYPSLWVQYKGRGQEWFGGELPYVFDWMNRKRRAAPLTKLGREGFGTTLGDEFQMLRATDNRFYWLTTDAISRAHLNPEPPNWSARVMAATVTALVAENNHVIVKQFGIRQATVWLGRGMTINFDKPVTVTVNLKQVFSQKVTPSMATMLEDLYERGDRQRLFVARVDVNF